MANDSTKKALDRYYEKLMSKEQSQEPKRKNKSPERDVQKEIHFWLKTNGFYSFRVESKAVYSHDLGRYMQGQTIAGCPDQIAVSPTGQFVACEVKAPGRRSTLREAQRSFLLEVISRGGFACVADSVSHFSSLWQSYQKTPDAMRKALLLKDLPREKIDDSPLFKMDQ